MNEMECRLIYREAFEDEDSDFENQLFEHCKEYCRTVNCGKETAAMLFLLPCEITNYQTKIDGYYIYAAATKKEYRKKGYMSRLIEEIKAENKLVFLKPATPDLVRFYARLGFKVFNTSPTENIYCKCVPKLGFAKMFPQNLDESSVSHTMMYVGETNLQNMYFPYVME